MGTPLPTDPQYEGRASLFGTLESGVASLSIKNVTVADTGEYICYIQHDSWYEKGNVFIEVKVLGSSPLMTVAYEGSGQVNVTCISEGWSPQPTVTWTNQKGIEIKKGLHEMHSIDDQGLMTVGSWLLAPPLGSDGYICSVGLSDLEKTQSRLALNLSQGKTSADTQTGVGGTVVIVLLVLVLLAVFMGLLYMYKKGLIKLPEKTDGRKADGEKGEHNPLTDGDIEGKGELKPLTEEEDEKNPKEEDAREVSDSPPVKPPPVMVDKGTNTEIHVDATTMPD
ncbi:butyrophilin subfamily 3 member A2-like [Engraulis encrasicolus]|uniref:butyrophilin subfamily 3 member A2-like n=1 Tax=Engraulis encrasicolus TaxID=184585 RepID=UPI002FD20CBD